MGLEEDDDVAAADVAVVDEGRPVRGWREGDAVDQDVVADEEGLLHGGGGDLEVLEDEGHDEEADGEDGADGGEGFERGLVLSSCFSALVSTSSSVAFVFIHLSVFLGLLTQQVYR